MAGVGRRGKEKGGSESHFLRGRQDRRNRCAWHRAGSRRDAETRRKQNGSALWTLRPCVSARNIEEPVCGAHPTGFAKRTWIPAFAGMTGSESTFIRVHRRFHLLCVPVRLRSGQALRLRVQHREIGMDSTPNMLHAAG